jgi:hypothetical protein
MDERAEGVRRPERVRVQLARGSAKCVAALTHLHRKPPETIASSRRSANMISAMLSALIHSHETLR